MSDISSTKREVEEHEQKGNPHSDSASATDLNNHESKGNPHSKSASTSDTASTSEIQKQALAYRLIGGM